MSDRNSAIENDQELKFSGEQGFFDKSRAIRLFILGIFAAAIFACIHFREFKIEVLELNSIAPNYIISQLNFDFSDDEATLILRQEAVRDIAKIYKINEKEVRQKRLEFENFLLYNQGWHVQADNGNFEELYKGADLIEKALLRIRFTDAKTLQKMEGLGVSTLNYQNYTPTTLSEPIPLPSLIWDNLQRTIFSSSQYNPLVVELVIAYFKNISWQMEEDVPAQKSIRKLIQMRVPEKITHIQAGSRIINQGDKVTGRHIAMLQALKEEIGKQRQILHPATIAGSLIMTLLVIWICLAYFQTNQPSLLTSNRKLFLLVTVLILTLGLAKLTEYFLLNSKNNLIEIVRYPLFVPLTAILLASLMNAGIAIFSSVLLAILLSLTLAFDRDGFLIINSAAALVAILNTFFLKRRKEIFMVCLKAWLCAVVVIIALHLYTNHLSSFSILVDILSACFFMLLTAVLVVGLQPLLESGFRIMTDVTLMEYMDPNNDLLRRLTVEASGTYQHSVVVGNLAEAAALAIGANGLFCRVATLYHDIGKMATSQYFTENQLGEVNIHQLLTPKESAQVIMLHVAEGVALGRAAGLPEPIIDIIKEHHGTTLVYYFYRKQLEQMGDDKALVDEKDFRYAGPKPRSKESGIIMIADSFEAASRSLDKINESTLTELADRLVRDKFDDKQFENCLLTFEELSMVKKVLVKTLLAAGHSRVKYPTPENRTAAPSIEDLTCN